MFFILMHRYNDNQDWIPDFTTRYDTPQEATERAKALNADSIRWSYGSRYKVRKVVDTDDDNFIVREAALNHKPIPWNTTTIYNGWSFLLPHIDPDNERHVRFFRTVEDAVCQKYTSMLMSRYMANWETFSTDEAQQILIDAGFYDNQDFGITNDRDKIIDIYTNGPSSCMNDPEEYELPDPHPAVVYSEGDFAVAYIGGEGGYSSRAVVCVTSKSYYCIYGHCKLMEDLLKKEGYTFHSSGTSFYEGMKVKKVELNGDVLMPYIDFMEYGQTSSCGNFIVLSNDSDSEYCVRSTSGFVDDGEYY